MKKSFIIFSFIFFLSFQIYPKTLIKITMGYDYVLKKMEVQGKVDYTEKSDDIVASSVSILAYTAHLTLMKLNSIKINSNNDGKTYVVEILKYDRRTVDEIRGITKFLINGFKLLEGNYKDEVSLNIKVE